MLDEKCSVDERDVEAGFILFQLLDDKKKWKGRLELVRTKDRKGRPATKLTILVEGRPDYTEQGLLDRLEKRLRDDLGRPESAPKAEPPAPEPAPAPKGDADGT